jgi:capsid portal protein
MAAGNTERTTLEIKPRVNQKSLVSRSAFGFIISDAPHFRNPYLTKVANQLGSSLRRS